MAAAARRRRRIAAPLPALLWYGTIGAVSEVQTWAEQAAERFADSGHPALSVRLKYGQGRARTISGIKRISKPGGRVHASSTDLPKVLGGMGIAILSTSSGMMTDREAKRVGVGGEVVAHIW